MARTTTADRTRLRRLTLALVVIGVGLPAQRATPPPEKAAEPPAVRICFAADTTGSGPPALLWLRTEVLPALSRWPSGFDSRQPFELRIEGHGSMRIVPGKEPPAASYLAGEFVLPGVGSVLLHCDAEGVEDWFVPGDAILPAGLDPLLPTLRSQRTPKTIDVGALAGNLAILAESDPRRPLLGIGAAHCGELTLAWWRTGSMLRVRGRSGGGLALPSAIVWIAALTDVRDTASWWVPPAMLTARPWLLQAFCARDGNRAEAVRQIGLQRASGFASLRALLHADDRTRLAAMDALVRNDSVTALPRIIAAARPEMPATVAMAEHALRELWPKASAEVQEEVRQLLRDHPVLDLRRRDPSSHGRDDDVADHEAAAWRWRLLIVLVLTATGLLGLWQRERRHLAGDLS